MTIQWLCCLLLLMVSSNVIAVASGERNFSSVRFSNLNTEVVLQQVGDGYVLYQTQASLPVLVTNRLIAKTRRDFSTAEFNRRVPKVKSVQQLAALQQENLWLVTISDINDLQAAITQLQQDAGVIYAHPDILQTREYAQQSGYSSNQPHLLREANAPAQPVRLAIIDDGFNFNHPQLAALKRVFEYDADLRTQDASPKSELDQHGTLVAGVISEVMAATADKQGVDVLAADVELIAIRQVSSWTSDMVLAFSVARMMQADIVNSSWVLPFLPEPLFDLLSDWSNDAQPYLIFAAGNNRRDACEANALSGLKSVWLIGAADKNGKRAPYSNYGSCVAFYAPAQFMSAAADGQGYKSFTGTSAATAYVSGFITHELAQGRRPDVQDVRQILKTGLTNGSSHP